MAGDETGAHEIEEKLKEVKMEWNEWNIYFD
jgi:hypothetical protein